LWKKIPDDVSIMSHDDNLLLIIIGSAPCFRISTSQVHAAIMQTLTENLPKTGRHRFRRFDLTQLNDEAKRINVWLVSSPTGD
jgi:hypothetical protein